MGEGVLIHPPHQGVCGWHGTEEQCVTSGRLIGSPGGARSPQGLSFNSSAKKEVGQTGPFEFSYRIEDRFEHGKDNGLGIAGIKESTLEKYSRRSAQRDAAIAKFMDENGRIPSNNETALLVRETRDSKLREISTPEVKARQYARMSPEEAETLKGLRQAALERGSVREQAPAAPSLTYAAEHTFERLSVAKDYELKTEALRHGRGRVELPELNPRCCPKSPAAGC
jgi:hypothetical protein